MEKTSLMLYRNSYLLFFSGTGRDLWFMFIEPDSDFHKMVKYWQLHIKSLTYPPLVGLSGNPYSINGASSPKLPCCLLFWWRAALWAGAGDGEGLSEEESQDNTDGNETRASECISSQRSNTISPSRNMTFYFNFVRHVMYTLIFALKSCFQCFILYPICS